MNFYLNDLSGYFKLYLPIILAISISFFMAVFTHFFIYQSLPKRFKTNDNLTAIFLNYVKNPLYLILILFYITIATYLLDFSVISEIISHVAKVLLMIVIMWSTIKVTDYLDVWIVKKYQFSSKNLDYAGTVTKYRLLKNFIKIFIIILGVSLILLSFDKVKEVGKGILLSAGVIGASIAFGAQRLVSNIIAGFQLTFIKPIKIGDILKVEDELGMVEEITLTSVTLCLWDLRRFVLPLNSLIEKPFINFTQPTSDLLGPVILHTDYNVDIDALRKFLIETLEANPLWDKKVGKLEVVELKENSLQLRALVSARNNEDLWNLSCSVREKIVKFLNIHFPRGLPAARTRVEILSKD